MKSVSLFAFLIFFTILLSSLGSNNINFDTRSSENSYDADYIEDIRMRLETFKRQHNYKENIEGWLKSFNLSLYGDRKLSHEDFINHVVNYKDELILNEMLLERKAERKALFRTEVIDELLRSGVIEEIWKTLTLKKKKWAVIHFLRAVEKYSSIYPDSELISSLQYMCYELWNDIENWQNVYNILFCIKAIEDIIYGPYNYNTFIEHKIKSTYNVTLHIVRYYSSTEDCYGDNDISFIVNMGGTVLRWDGPSDVNNYYGNIEFTVSTSNNLLRIDIQVIERDSGLCTDDDDYGKISIIYDLTTKKWHGDTSEPKAYTRGLDGECYFWFHIQSDSDNNHLVLYDKYSYTGYLIGEYDGTAYKDENDIYYIFVDSSIIESKKSVYLELTNDLGINTDLYLYDSNGKLLASSSSTGQGGVEQILYRLNSSTDSPGLYICDIRLVGGYGTYTIRLKLLDLCLISVRVFGLQNENVVVSYRKMGNSVQRILTSSSPSFSDQCDNNSVLSLTVPSGLYTYDPTSYTIKGDMSITVRYYRYPIRIMINEISSRGVGNDEWIEIYSASLENVYINGWKIIDQDGNEVLIGDSLEPMPPNSYLIIYFGSGINDFKFSDDGIARIYANAGVNFLNDDGDDILLLYMPTSKPIDYVAYSAGTGNLDIDLPPTGIVFRADGLGAGGLAPAPPIRGSISLIPHGKDRDRAYDWYITNSSYVTPGRKNINLLNVSGESIISQNVFAGSTNVPVLRIFVEALGGVINITQITVRLEGNATETDIPNIYLYKDTNGDGALSAGDALIDNSRFSGRVAVFSGFVLMLGEGEKTYLFVSVDISGSHTSYSHYFYLKIHQSDIVVSSNSIVFIRKEIISNPATIISGDSNPPRVEKYYVEPSTLISGNIYVNTDFKITIIFNEDMKTTVEPSITFNKPIFMIISRGWIDKRSYYVMLKVPDNVEDSVEIKIANASDLAGNSCQPYSIKIFVDTLEPAVTNVFISNYTFIKEKLYVAGNFTLILYFSERINTSIYPKLLVTPSNVTSYKIFLESSYVIINFRRIHNITTVLNIELEGIRDYVGNSISKVSYSFVYDSERPRAKILLDRESPIGRGSIKIRIIFSEMMNSSSEIFVSVLARRVVGAWINETVWEGSYTVNDEYGMSEITVRGARDMVGNILEPAVKSVIFDTRPPTIKDVVFKKEVTEEEDFYIYIYASDEYSNISKVLVWYKLRGSMVASECMVTQEGWYTVVPADAIRPPFFSFYIEVEDSLGNILKSDTYRIEVIPWYISKWWIWIVVIAVLIILFALISYIRRKKLSKSVPLKESLIDVVKSKIKKGESDEEFYEDMFYEK